MNNKKARQVRICECGAQYLTSEKFGNEEICSACYAAKRAALDAAFALLPLETQDEVLAFIAQYSAELDIDKTAASLLSDVDI